MPMKKTVCTPYPLMSQTLSKSIWERSSVETLYYIDLHSLKDALRATLLLLKAHLPVHDDPSCRVVAHIEAPYQLLLRGDRDTATEPERATRHLEIDAFRASGAPPKC